MIDTSVHPVERAVFESQLIHAATCRYRKQGLACSTCTDLAERVRTLLAGIKKAAA